jgi:enoyl-CoA hydratase/carnithine racemase
MSRARLDCRDGLAFIRVDGPPGNLTDAEFFHDLRRIVLDELPGIDVRGIVLYGQGRHFSAGADLQELRGRVIDSPQDLGENRETFLALEMHPGPVVAAVDGCCMGSGLELALACHAVVATDRTLFSLPEATMGLMPGCGGTVRLARRVGFGAAVDLILSGRSLDAAEALRAGLIDVVVSRADLHRSAETLALRLADIPGGAG